MTTDLKRSVHFKNIPALRVHGQQGKLWTCTYLSLLHHVMQSFIWDLTDIPTMMWAEHHPSTGISPENPQLSSHLIFQWFIGLRLYQNQLENFLEHTGSPQARVSSQLILIWLSYKAVFCNHCSGSWKGSHSPFLKCSRLEVVLLFQIFLVFAGS